MKLSKRLSACTLVVILAIGGTLAMSEEEQPQPDMKKVMKLISPGPMHKTLDYFVGTWDVEVAITMPGMPAGAPTKMVQETRWLMQGRWISEDIKGALMGRPYHGFSIAGYDNHTKNFVVGTVSNMDTQMNLFRGVQVDPENKVFTHYGTINEWMDDTFNKPVKAVTRLVDADHYTREIWDLQIGAEGKPVMLFKYARRKAAATK